MMFSPAMQGTKGARNPNLNVAFTIACAEV